MPSLLNRDAIPDETISPDGVDIVNDIVDRFRKRLVDNILVPEPGSGFRVSNMIRGYSQAFLRRGLSLADASVREYHAGDGLASIVMVRCMYEATAAYCDFAQKIMLLLDEGDLQEIHDFVQAKTFATRLDKLVELAGTEDVKSTSILTQINKLKKRRSEVWEEYEHLSEYVHPNAFGVFQFFGDHVKETDQINFRKPAIDRSDVFHWIAIGIFVLGMMESDMIALEERLPALSELGLKNKPN